MGVEVPNALERRQPPATPWDRSNRQGHVPWIEAKPTGLSLAFSPMKTLVLTTSAGVVVVVQTSPASMLARKCVPTCSPHPVASLTAFCRQGGKTGTVQGLCISQRSDPSPRGTGTHLCLVVRSYLRGSQGGSANGRRNGALVEAA